MLSKKSVLTALLAIVLCSVMILSSCAQNAPVDDVPDAPSSDAAVTSGDEPEPDIPETSAVDAPEVPDASYGFLGDYSSQIGEDAYSYELNGRYGFHPVVIGEHKHVGCDASDEELMALGQSKFDDAVKLYRVIYGTATVDLDDIYYYDGSDVEQYALDKDFGTYDSIMELREKTFAPDTLAWKGYYAVEKPAAALSDEPGWYLAEDGSKVTVTITSELERAMLVVDGKTYRVANGRDTHRLWTKIIGVTEHTDTHIEYGLCTMVLDESAEALAVSDEIPQVFYEHSIMKLDLIDGEWLITQLNDDLGNEHSFNETFVANNGLIFYD